MSEQFEFKKGEPEGQHVNPDGQTDAEKGAMLGGLGGAVTGAVAGSMVGPVGAVTGGIIGAVAGAVASGVAVSEVDKHDNDDPVTGLDPDPDDVSHPTVMPPPSVPHEVDPRKRSDPAFPDSLPEPDPKDNPLNDGRNPRAGDDRSVPGLNQPVDPAFPDSALDPNDPGNRPLSEDQDPTRQHPYEPKAPYAPQDPVPNPVTTDPPDPMRDGDPNRGPNR